MSASIDYARKPLETLWGITPPLKALAGCCNPFGYSSCPLTHGAITEEHYSITVRLQSVVMDWLFVAR
jgi:hypothetical protein